MILGKLLSLSELILSSVKQAPDSGWETDAVSSHRMPGTEGSPRGGGALLSISPSPATPASSTGP